MELIRKILCNLKERERERAFCLSLLLISLSEQDSISIEKTFLVNMLVHRNGAMELMGANLELY
jgi:hypothetical protein